MFLRVHMSCEYYLFTVVVGVERTFIGYVIAFFFGELVVKKS